MRTSTQLLGMTLLLAALVPVARAQQCDDFTDCTVNDMCADGVCTGTPQGGGSCDDGDECTVNDRCQPDGGCAGEEGAEGTPCQHGCGTCQRVAPVPGVPLTCSGDLEDNGKPCDFGAGACFRGACRIFGVPGFPAAAVCIPEFIECEDTDGNPCTDSCNPATGQCERDVPRCLPDCETCNTGTGQCEPANIGAACDDFNLCTSASRCEAFDVGGAQRGICMPGEPSGGSPTPTHTPDEGGPTPTPGECVGDCNNDGQNAVNEMVVGVNILLGNASIDQCPSFDTNANNGVEVNELVSGVNGLLNGCV